MELPERDVATSWLGLPVEDVAGGRVGTCTAVYADDATDRPEWALVQSALDDSLRMVPLVDAHKRGGSLRLSFAADLIDTAPRMGNPDHLTQAEEAELYQHYGVPFSAGPSDSLLPSAAGDEAVEPAMAAAPGVTEARHRETATMPPLEPEPLPAPEPLVPDPMPEPLVPAPVPEPLQPTPAPEPRPSPPAPTPPPAPTTAPRPAPSPPPPTVGSEPPARTGVPAEGIVAGLAGVSTAVVLLLRERRRSVSRRPATRPGVRSAKAALGGAAGAVTAVAEAVGSELSRTTDQLGKATAGVAHGGARAVTDAADSAKDVAVQSRRQVRRRRRKMGRSWRRTTTRTTAVVGAGAGYLLGARAGERRYADIRTAASRLADRLRG